PGIPAEIICSIVELSIDYAASWSDLAKAGIIMKTSQQTTHTNLIVAIISGESMAKECNSCVTTSRCRKTGASSDNPAC
ncbi:MAG TPA: hypothetical protein VFG52_04690, partial [Xanthomonadales bacterium]|nr:hypothetical protein [Xanthomonadales bacterium]